MGEWSMGVSYKEFSKVNGTKPDDIKIDTKGFSVKWVYNRIYVSHIPEQFHLLMIFMLWSCLVLIVTETSVWHNGHSLFEPLKV